MVTSQYTVRVTTSSGTKYVGRFLGALSAKRFASRYKPTPERQVLVMPLPAGVNPAPITHIGAGFSEINNKRSS